MRKTMKILDKRADFEFAYPAAFNGTASGILVLLGDAIMLEWNPSTLEIKGNYNITMACNDNGAKSDFFFKTATNISTPYLWKFTEGYANDTVTCYYGYFTPTGDKETSQSFQFINKSTSSPKTFRASAAKSTSTPTHSSNLSAGAKAGIAIASIVAAVSLLAIAIYFVLRIRKAKVSAVQAQAQAQATELILADEDKKPPISQDFAESPNQLPVEVEARERPQDLAMPYHVQEMPGSKYWEEGTRIQNE